MDHPNGPVLPRRQTTDADRFSYGMSEAAASAVRATLAAPPGTSLGYSAAMADVAPIQGELQTQVMAALWRIGSGTVEQVRTELPRRYRGAYTTVQTVLNRLAERGLLTREQQGRGIVYRPKLTEADYLSGTIRRTLAGASSDARRAALASIVGGLSPDELAELRQLAATRSRCAGGRRS